MTPEYHSPLGGSVAHRFMACPGSITLGAGADRESSIHADTGTVAHELAAVCLKSERDAWEFIGRVVETEYSITVDKDMADAVQVYLDYIREKHGEHEHAFIEELFCLPDLHPDFAGTADFVAVADGSVHIIDYKHGVGNVVEARNNPQLMYYAAGTLEQLSMWSETKLVYMTIVQPRASHAFGPIRHWVVSVEKLHTWLFEELLPAMYATSYDHSTNAGAWCTFCPCLVRQCPALASVDTELEELMAIPLNELTPEQIGRILELGVIFKKQHAAVQKAALAKAEKGVAIPGYKLARKHGYRVWRDGAPVEEEFGSEAYNRKLKSPAQIQNLPQGKAFVTRWAHAPETGHGLVPEGDSRPAQGPAQKSMFQPVNKG